MNRTFEIVGSAILSIAGLAFIVWLSVRTLKRTEDPVKLILKWAFTIPFVIFCMWTARQLGPSGPFLIVFMAVVLSVMWTPHISEVLTRPLAGCMTAAMSRRNPNLIIPSR
jgi:predicted neutral ceramidase superfamily lipid hydrolase